jgi:hypothetical protein
MPGCQRPRKGLDRLVQPTSHEIIHLLAELFESAVPPGHKLVLKLFMFSLASFLLLWMWRPLHPSNYFETGFETFPIALCPDWLEIVLCILKQAGPAVSVRVCCACMCMCVHVCAHSHTHVCACMHVCSMSLTITMNSISAGDFLENDALSASPILGNAWRISYRDGTRSCRGPFPLHMESTSQPIR